jgi:hypothetical protein
MEVTIMTRNQHHARQTLHTPFTVITELANAVDPTKSNNKIDTILDGTFLESLPQSMELTPTEKAWIQELKQKLGTTIDIHISTSDFKSFFKTRKERTASTH